MPSIKLTSFLCTNSLVGIHCCTRVKSLEVGKAAIGIAVVMLLTACSSQRVPVIERSAGASSAIAPVAPVVLEPGYYRVKRGDTLYRIALENGQSYRDIALWNNLNNPDQIEVGQVLRVSPPIDSAPRVVVGAPIKSNEISAKPLTPEISNESAKDKNKELALKEASKEVPLADVNFIWPSKGQILTTFDDAKNKGVDIAGKLGDPIKAAGDGKVVYAGNGLRGYGNLIIIKHNNAFLTAYAHNRALLAKEGEQVKAGQTIAEMGNTDSDRIKLHFEVRRYGKPIDPMRYLPEKK